MKKIVFTLMTILLLIMGGIFMMSEISNKDCLFNREKWLLARTIDDTDLLENKSEPRQCMIADLALRHLRKGMAESDVIRLLGFEALKEVSLDDNVFGGVGGVNLLYAAKTDHEYLNASNNNRVKLDNKDYVYLYYMVGLNEWSDTCLINISFNKSGLMEKAFYYCD